jgi:hypothetical protein
VSIRAVFRLGSDPARVTPERPAGTVATIGRVVAAALVSFAIWRGALLCFDLLGLSLTPNMGRCRKNWQVFGAGHDFLNGFFRWDAGWYLQIAERGYSFRPDKSSSVAFFPLFPMLSRYLGKLMGGHAIAGLVIANVASVGAIAYLRLLGQALFSDRIGKLAVTLLLVFPTSLFLSAYYTEGLFLCCAIGAMYHYFRRQFVWCGCLGFLAMLTRSTGIVLFSALALDLGYQLYCRKQHVSWRMLWLLAMPAGLGVYLAFLHFRFGDALAFVKTQEHWDRHSSFPWTPVWDALRATDYTFPVSAKKTQRFIDAASVLGLLAAAACMAKQRYPVALWSYVLIGTIMPLTTYNIASMNRYVLSLFPIFLLLARLCQGRRELERWIFFASAFFLAIYSLRFMQCGWAG